MGFIRIVGGSLRGRRLAVPDVPGVRPTADRVREAVFNILGQTLSGERVLDAFAGSGALGFEAVSRGAGSVVFVESNRAIAGTLREAAAALGVSDRVSVVHGDARRGRGAGALGGPFDLVLADPPYAAGAGTALLVALDRDALLAEGARIVVERSTGEGPPDVPEGLELVRTARYGATSVDFLEKSSARARPTP